MPSPIRMRTLGVALLCVAFSGTATGQRLLPKPTLNGPIPPLVYEVFFTDGTAGSAVDVGRMSLPGTRLRTLSDSDPVIGPLGLVVDPLRCLLYVGTGPPDWGVLRMNLDGTDRTEILDLGLNEWPRGIALDPVSNRLYFIVPSQPWRIRSCALDGSGPMNLVSSVSPFSIHVDADDRKIYWWDTVFMGFRAGNIGDDDTITCVKDVYHTGPAVLYEVDTVNNELYWGENPVMGLSHIYRVAIPADGVDPCAPSTCDEATCPPEVFAVEPATLVTFRSWSLSALPENRVGSPKKGVVAWVLGNDILRWRALQGTWPVAVHEANDLPNLVVNSIEVVRATASCWKSGVFPIVTGGRLVLRFEEDLALAPVAVRLGALDGRPVSVPLFEGQLDGEARLELTLPVHTSLAGKTARLELVLVDSAGRTRRESTTVQLP